MLKLVVQKSKILTALKLIKSRLRLTEKKAKGTSCEVSLTDDKITVAVAKTVISTECHVEGNAKIILPFFYFFDIIEKTDNSLIEMIIDDGEMSIGSLTIGSITTFIEVEKGRRTIDLPLNYTDMDLILLKTGKYTKEELAFNNLNSIIELAERNLEKNIEKASRILKMYGIKKSELELWVNERLGK